MARIQQVYQSMAEELKAAGHDVVYVWRQAGSGNYKEFVLKSLDGKRCTYKNRRAALLDLQIAWMRMKGMI